MYHIFTNKLWDIFSPRWAQGRCLRTRFSLSKYFLTSFIYSSNELRPPFERSWVINRGFFETIIPSVFTNAIVMWKSFLLADFDLFVAWNKKKKYRPTSLIHHYGVEGVLGLGEREHRQIQWPRVSLLTRGTLQIRIQFVRQRSDPTLEQTNMNI